ncbi:N-acetylmuramoyl-L-alanine amidase [Glaciecola petra]|uniref:N-acetylmuramoyl-L-alanine amidase n=1 Tax=Glaciecola petra TaxID=3075602 RepID=A0ABU2ZU77_9ALTE|nr:N-acetylmuramoyl-L-alanine amidase [Aestuariibacter sp. P117]MDT0596193.1 N-acetylmuramoyl-L-alanine amidase [Aestuariibacter sp. P117]
MGTFLRIPYFLFILLSVFVSSANADNSIEQVRFSDTSDTARIVLEFKSEPKYSYFSLQNPHRMVLDLQGVERKFDFSTVTISGNKIKRLRHSTPKSSNDTRMVIEANKKLNPRVFILNPTEGFSYRLVVELVDPDPVPVSPINNSGPNRDQDIIVIIDAGHGGNDPGSIGPEGTYEKHITLSISKKLDKLIDAQPGMRGVMTRESDYYISPNDRPKVAARENADLLVSIHADAFTTPQPKGGSVWVLSKGRADTELGRLLEQTERSSELLGAAADVIGDRDTERYFAETIFNMSMDLSRALSYELSHELIKDMKQVTSMHKKTPQSASLAVLTAPETPSVLIEVGFISNPQEEKNLNWEKHRQRLAEAIFRSIKRYFKKTPPDGTLWAKWKNEAPAIHKVTRGESLSLLAQRYGVSVKELKDANGLRSDLVRIGQELTIPK